MRWRDYTENEKLHEGVCTNCGIPFAVPEKFLDEKRKNRSTFRCPNGCRLVYTPEEPEIEQGQLTKKHDYHHWYYENVTKAKRQQQKSK